MRRSLCPRITSIGGISAADAEAAAASQARFFKDVDAYKVNPARPLQPVALKGSKEALAKWMGRMKTAFADLGRPTPSETVVVRAACYLLTAGLLSIPDVGSVNVKQARALLWVACWLQYHMNGVWHEEGVLEWRPAQPEEALFEEFQLAIIGAGGDGQDHRLAPCRGSHRPFCWARVGAQMCHLQHGRADPGGRYDACAVQAAFLRSAGSEWAVVAAGAEEASTAVEDSGGLLHR